MKKVVLDTSCVRGTPRWQLEELERRGFELGISVLALDELLVYFTADAQKDKKQEQLRARLSWFNEHFGGDVPLRPTHAPLVNMLGGRLVRELAGMDFPFQPWLERQQWIWRGIVTGEPYPPELLEAIEEQSAYVKDSGESFVRTVSWMGSLGSPTEEEEELTRALWKLLPPVISCVHLDHPIGPEARWDAYVQVQRVHALQSFARANSQAPKIQPNHAVDLNLLQHLAEGAFLLTEDVELIELVDASGSPQAPWVRTVPEMLIGGLPKGPPFLQHARRAAKKHRPRTRQHLQGLREQATHLRPNSE